MRKFSLLAAFLAATACGPMPSVDVSKSRALPPDATSALNARPAFMAQGRVAQPVAMQRSNADMAATFMELSFALESGRSLPHFSRFEGPISVKMTGAVPASAGTDLAALMSRLRREAGIDIRPAAQGEAAAITIEFNPRAKLRRATANASCFVVPNVTTLAQYHAQRGQPATDWAVVAQRRTVGIFLPSDGTPQEIRDCLHEELAQALGPLNDLYRLTDSVFNDDNFNAVLTFFDMTMLRAYYAPELQTGMSRAEVASRIGTVMNRVHPSGAGRAASADLSPTPRAWSMAIESALGGRKGQAGRVAAAERALAMAHAQGWRDGRLALSHFALARAVLAQDRARAVAEYTKAATLYRSLPGAQLHAAHIDMQLAAIAVASGQPQQALHFTDRALPAIRQGQNHALLATTQLIRAEALQLLGDSAAAQALRVDSQPAARYGFGSEIRARSREIAALGAGWLRG